RGLGPGCAGETMRPAPDNTGSEGFPLPEFVAARKREVSAVNRHPLRLEARARRVSGLAAGNRAQSGAGVGVLGRDDGARHAGPAAVRPRHRAARPRLSLKERSPPCLLERRTTPARVRGGAGRAVQVWRPAREALVRPSGSWNSRRRDQTAASDRPVCLAASGAGRLRTSSSSSSVQGRPALGGPVPRRLWASLIFRPPSAL